MNESHLQPPSLPQRKTSSLAICSLIFGILSIIMPCLAIFTVIPGIICGHMGLSRINRSGGALDGRGLAVAGLVTSYVGILWGGLILAIAIPNFIKARDTAMHYACVNNLRMIQAAKNEWALEKGKDGGAIPTEADLTPYLAGGKFPTTPAGATYTIGAVTNEATCTLNGQVIQEGTGTP